MSSARRSRERRYFAKLQRGYACPGCGQQAVSVPAEDRGRYWYLPHVEGCPVLAEQEREQGGAS